MKTFSIVDPIFKTEPLFIVNCSYTELQKYLLAKYKITIPDEENGNYFGGSQLSFCDAPWRVVWVKEFKNQPEQLGFLLHELFHLVVRICTDKGIPIVAKIDGGWNGDEPAAYLYEFFAKECLRKVRRMK